MLLKGRAKQAATKGATHLRLSSDVHRAGPFHFPLPWPPKVVITTLLSLTLKSTLEDASERSRWGRLAGVCARTDPRNTVLRSHIRSHNPHPRPAAQTNTNAAAARRAPMGQKRSVTYNKQQGKRKHSFYALHAPILCTPALRSPRLDAAFVSISILCGSSERGDLQRGKDRCACRLPGGDD